MYSIICDARGGERYGINVLALVDRKKSKELWWTSDNPAIMLCYDKKTAAEFAVRRLKQNNARIVPYTDAKELIQGQRSSIADVELDDGLSAVEYEEGWDGHKAF